MIIATWKQGFGFYKADAQKVAEEIYSIGEHATPEQILELGKHPNSELHKCFEWDDSVAAEKYRIEQARHIVRTLVIQRTPDEVAQEKPEIRVFYTTATTKSYTPTEIIMQNKSEYDALLEQAYRELRAFKNKYSMLSELGQIFELIA